MVAASSCVTWDNDATSPRRSSSPMRPGRRRGQERRRQRSRPADAKTAVPGESDYRQKVHGNRAVQMECPAVGGTSCGMTRKSGESVGLLHSVQRAATLDRRFLQALHRNGQPGWFRRACSNPSGLAPAPDGSAAATSCGRAMSPLACCNTGLRHPKPQRRTLHPSHHLEPASELKVDSPSRLFAVGRQPGCIAEPRQRRDHTLPAELLASSSSRDRQRARSSRSSTSRSIAAASSSTSSGPTTRPSSAPARATRTRPRPCRRLARRPTGNRASACEMTRPFRNDRGACLSRGRLRSDIAIDRRTAPSR